MDVMCFRWKTIKYVRSFSSSKTWFKDTPAHFYKTKVLLIGRYQKQKGDDAFAHVCLLAKWTTFIISQKDVQLQLLNSFSQSYSRWLPQLIKIGCVQIQGLSPSKDPANEVWVCRIIDRPRRLEKMVVNLDNLGACPYSGLCPVMALNTSKNRSKLAKCKCNGIINFTKQQN